jgi:hypothetical protein
MTRAAILLVASALAAAPAAAQECTARYSFVQVEAGALRLDMETGAVALCRAGADGAHCTEAAAASPGTIDTALVDRLAALEARVASLEAERDGGPLPDDEAMDRVMALTERAMRRFFSVVEGMKREMEGNEL